MPEAPTRPEGHRSYRVKHRSGYLGASYVARCACGWCSEPYPTSGMAGAAWDDHAEGAQPC